jgi:DNA-dependent RNA polymerase auxiliary subunit epsilon
MKERRRSPRYAVSVPVTLYTEAGLVAGHTLNISFHGALVRSPRLPRVEEGMDMILALPLGAVVAKVRVIRVELENNRFAVEFVTILENPHLLLDLLASASARSKID